MRFGFFICILLAWLYSGKATARPRTDDTLRTLHYRPQGKDFVLVRGRRKFNRALYGSNTAFRVEAGDLPEFSMYLPGMGGNLRLGLRSGNRAIWLNDADSIETRYSEGGMIYRIRDRVLKNGTLTIEVRALAETEGMILRVGQKNAPKDVELLAVYGGLSMKKFSRNGDIGADPEDGFELKPEYCANNMLRTGKLFPPGSPGRSTFSLEYHNPKTGVAGLSMEGDFPESMTLFNAGFDQLDPATLKPASDSAGPVLAGTMKLVNTPAIFVLRPVPADVVVSVVQDPRVLFDATRKANLELWNRITVNTPDSFINTLGGALGMAADGIWESPSYLHGAVAWRMRLNAWRGAYVADPLGWHERAKAHFRGYARSQLTTPGRGPVTPDTALHFARQQEKLGTAVFSSGYIPRNPGGDQRPHHYDMNLVFIDQLLNHFDWTGDTAFVREMWPLLTRHLAWEKRNFDYDGDGLYDAYAAIWASDGLQYSGGGAMHSSAYNLKANRAVAELARILKEDAAPFQLESDKIKAAIESKLWLESGWYAEYRDLLGEQLAHPQAAAWTIYHTIDSKVPNASQAAQVLQYADRELPRIPYRVKGLERENFFLTSTTNWQPYDWSINNVALGESLHLSLAYWQGNRAETAFQIWKSALLESMYLSASPGGFQQLSALDAVRGELYRDFADPIGMAARSLMEGLFGFRPDAMHDSLAVRPGFPRRWNHASIRTPDYAFRFSRKGMSDSYSITQRSGSARKLRLELSMAFSSIQKVSVNGAPASYRLAAEAGRRYVIIECGNSRDVKLELQWTGKNARVEDILQAEPSPLPATANRPWIAPGAGSRFETVSLSSVFNDSVASIFKHRYLSPRPQAPTLQLPWQGIGNWCYPLITAAINDSGVRAVGRLSYDGVPFVTAPSGRNIAFTSKWDNFPDSVSIPLGGNARHVYLLMAGTTNPAQSQFENGQVIVQYTDGTRDVLSLRNPETWWPIEQDYFENGLAFHLKMPPLPRLELKTGRFYRMDQNPPVYTSIKGFSNRAVDGGAATLLNLPLNPQKTLKSLTVKSLANDVIIGLMSTTLVR